MAENEMEAFISGDETEDDLPETAVAANEPGTSRKRAKRGRWPDTEEDKILDRYPHTKFDKGSREATRFEKIRTVELAPGGVICYEALRAVGLYDRALQFLGEDTPWTRLYQQDLPAYREMTVEFLSTFR
jgi:hypothetical protein